MWSACCCSSAEWNVQNEIGSFFLPSSDRAPFAALKPATRSSQKPAAAQFSMAKDAAIAVESASFA